MPNYCYHLLLALILLYNSKLNAQKYDIAKELTTIDHACSDGWMPFAPDGALTFTKCIKVFGAFRKTWRVAEGNCEELNGAHLVTVTTKAQLRLLMETIRTALSAEHLTRYVESHMLSFNNSQWWIGLAQLCPHSRTDVMPPFRFADGTIDLQIDQTKMIDGIPIKYESRNLWDGHYCVALHIITDESGVVSEQFFKVHDCGERLSFVCEMPAYRQEIAADGLIMEEGMIKKETENTDDQELTDEFPCGRNPFHCPMATDDGTICFHVLREPRNWKAAEEECTALYNSKLASVHSLQDVEFIYKMILMQPTINSSDSRHWIGLHRKNFQSAYEWTDGTPFDFQGVQVVADPEHQRGYCEMTLLLNNAKPVKSIPSEIKKGRLMSKDRPVYAWSNQRCDQKLRAICKKSGYGHKDHEVSSKKNDPKRRGDFWRCHKDRKLFRGMCYKLYSGQDQKTFKGALRYCRSWRSTLVSLVDAYEHGFVLSMLKEISSDAWIGLDMTEGRLRWLDGEPFHFTRFNPNNQIITVDEGQYLFQANLAGGFSENACAVLDATKMVGYWSVIYNTTEYSNPHQLKELEVEKLETGNCETKVLPFVCETFAEKVTGIEKPEQNCFDMGNVTYCFLPVGHDDNVTGLHDFVVSSEICESLLQKPDYAHLKRKYGQLAEVNDLFEWSFLTAMALDHQVDDFFVGVLYWTGTGFMRTDRVRLRLTPWGIDEPDLQSGNCVAVKIGRTTPYWFMDNCHNKKRVVCRFSNEEPVAEIPHSIKCPPGKEKWIHGKTQCYHLITNSSIFTNGFKADYDCFKLYNASLASFPTKEDFYAFKKHMIHDKLAVPYAFIGLMRQEEGSFAWKDASPLTFLNWAPGMPKIRLGREGEECVQMQLRNDYTWQVVDCMQKQHFICSVPGSELAQPVDYDFGALPTLPMLGEESTSEPQEADEILRILDEEKGRGRKKVGHNEDGAGAPSESSSSPKPSSSWAAKSSWKIILISFVCLIVVSMLFMYFYWQRYHVIVHPRDEHIVQFDSLQNEQECEI